MTAVFMQNVLERVPDLLAVGRIDLSSGHLFEFVAVEFDPSLAERATAATRPLFRSPTAASIENAFRRARCPRLAATTQEAGELTEGIVLSAHLVHLFVRGVGDQALVAVCRPSAKVGVVLAEARRIAAELEPDIATVAA